MPHERRNGEVIVPLNQLTSAETVPCRVSEHLFAGSFRDAKKTITDRIFSPRVSAIIAEDFAVICTVNHQALDDLQGIALEIYNPLGAFPFRFFGGKYNTLPVKLDMTRLYMSCFLRPATCLIDEDEKPAERITLAEKAKDLVKILFRHVRFPTLRSRLFQAGNWVGIYIAELDSPVIHPLDGHNRAASKGISPCRMAVYPFSDVIGLELESRDANIGPEVLPEALKVPGVPLSSPGGSVLLAPREILGKNVVYCNAAIHEFSVEAGELQHGEGKITETLPLC